jgi:hypothetical protein
MLKGEGRHTTPKTARKKAVGPRLYQIPPGAIIINDLPATRTVGGNTNDKVPNYDYK